MDIRYKNNKLETVCTDANTARREYGREMARKIHLRIDQLRFATSIQSLILNGVGRCHKLVGDRKTQYAMDLVHPSRLIFIHIDGMFHVVEIQEIVDYH